MAKPPFPWIGSKEKIAPYILQLFPPKLTQYVEPFGGSGAVLLALPPDPNRCAEIICHADGIHFAREFCADHESQSGIHSISRSRTAPSPKYTSTFHGRYRLL